MKIVVMTSTYNNANNLSKLHSSLINQSYSNFSWIIINDGSKDNTNEVVKNIISNSKLDINYIDKKNTGKSNSLNVGFEQIKEDEFCLIVDDDEYLYAEALEKASVAAKYYDNKNIASIHFLRINKTNNNIIANYEIESDLEETFVDFKDKGYSADGYIGYYGKVLKNNKFPKFLNDKYIGPSVLLMEVNKKYNMIWSSEILGETEYLDGGITKQGRKLRVKNPLSMLYYCNLYVSQSNRIKSKLIYSTMGYAYKYLAIKKYSEIIENYNTSNNLLKSCKFVGYLLSKVWNKKYKISEINDDKS